MNLELIDHHVSRIVPGGRTALRQGTLELDTSRLARLLAGDRRLTQVAVDVVHPGESCRIVHVLDVFEPRAKIEPPGPAFPGVTGPPVTAGSGRTRRFGGAAVVLAGLPPDAGDPAVFQEAVIEMTGPAARACPFSRTANVVVSVATDPALGFDEAAGAIRLAGARAAEYVGHADVEDAPDAVERFVLRPPESTLPRVALVLQLEAWGSIQRSFLYGLSVDGLLPTLLHPNEVLDGALTCGTYHQASIRHFTHLLQDHQVVRQLYRRHGRDLDFTGVVVQRALWASDDDKRRSAAFAARLLRQLGVAGAIVTFAHGGHAITDTVLTCEACERAGVRVATLMFEMAGEDGFDFALVQGARGAEPLCSTGNAYARVSLPRVDRVLGGDALHGLGGHADARQPACGPLDLSLCYVAGANGATGWGRLTAREG
jgi:glycine reductase